jgi:hypothetical protein
VVYFLILMGVNSNINDENQSTDALLCSIIIIIIIENQSFYLQGGRLCAWSLKARNKVKESPSGPHTVMVVLGNSKRQQIRSCCRLIACAWGAMATSPAAGGGGDNYPIL